MGQLVSQTLLAIVSFPAPERFWSLLKGCSSRYALGLCTVSPNKHGIKSSSSARRFVTARVHRNLNRKTPWKHLPGPTHEHLPMFYNEKSPRPSTTFRCGQALNADGFANGFLVRSWGSRAVYHMARRRFSKLNVTLGTVRKSVIANTPV
jgi:hypothetical protein